MDAVNVMNYVFHSGSTESIPITNTHTHKASINSVILRYEDVSTVYLLPKFRENVVASS